MTGVPVLMAACVAMSARRDAARVDVSACASGRCDCQAAFSPRQCDEPSYRPSDVHANAASVCGDPDRSKLQQTLAVRFSSVA